jgi:hypothetical protein
LDNSVSGNVMNEFIHEHKALEGFLIFPPSLKYKYEAQVISQCLMTQLSRNSSLCLYRNVKKRRVEENEIKKIITGFNGEVTALMLLKPRLALTDCLMKKNGTE